ncbi:MAG TPA: glutamate--tRNA ligase [Gemmatimonadales bacterium]|nr:glutamate--tRNA ligase [Gemmatimonadales bacterium]
MAPRVRFAPSPTGYLHVGGARTALFNWLYAKKTGGTMILRIEDTDKERSTDSHTQVILDGLTWLGITWDEGPVFQGAEVKRHQADAKKLLDAGKAYYCFCTKEELDAQRAVAEKAKSGFKYDRRCSKLSPAQVEEKLKAGLPASIRIRMPQEELAWDDAVHGHITFQGHDLDDFIILRSDGTPIYNLAVVSDDIAMRITHVIRGDDHVSNTPKQIAIYRALGAEVPTFAHVPMILGNDGKKLSKRHGATAVGDYQAKGILPVAMRNFLALLGWSPGGDREIMPEAEMVEAFSLERIQSKPAVFDTDKLEWMNGQYLSMRSAEELEPEVRRELTGMGVDFAGRDLRPIIDAVKARSRLITDIANQAAVRLDPTRAVVDEKGAALQKKLGAAFGENLKAAAEVLANTPADQWTPGSTQGLADALKAAAESKGVKLGDLMQPIRVVLTGSTVSEPVDQLLGVVGRDASLEWLKSWAG